MPWRRALLQASYHDHLQTAYCTSFLLRENVKPWRHVICGQFPSFLDLSYSTRRRRHSSLRFFPLPWTKHYSIKGAYVCPDSSLLSTLNTPRRLLQPPSYHILLTTMLFNKFIISFVSAIALATSVTAAPNRDAHPDSVNQARDISCNSGILACCGSTISFDSLSAEQQYELLNLDSNVNEEVNVGMHCVAATSTTCGNHRALCCDVIHSSSFLPNVAANCF
ncbi:hypothetical protein EI94DRAFT_958602 [Lactarius quietus]|nr:hypothetical protein EI94DRAFT_958602 [Lactarius quietus]